MIKLFDLKGLDAREPFFLFLIFFYVIHHQHYESFLFQPQSPIPASHIYEGIALVCKQMLKGSSYKYLLFISDRKCLSSLKFYCVDIFFYYVRVLLSFPFTCKKGTTHLEIEKLYNLFGLKSGSNIDCVENKTRSKLFDCFDFLHIEDLGFKN